MTEPVEFEIVTDGLAFPEGPVALPGGDVLVVEVRAGLLTRVAPDGSRATVAVLGGGPNGAAIGPDGWVYVVNNGGFAWSEHGPLTIPGGPDGSNAPEGFRGGWVDRVELVGGRVERLYEGCDGDALLGPNDIVFDTAGGFWFTDFGKMRRRSVDLGGVYYATTDGTSIQRRAEGLHGPNGIGLSPDGRRLYVAETYTGRLLEWDLAGPGQVAGPPRVVVSTAEHFDSLAVEADGTVVIGAIRGLCAVRPGRDWSVLDLPDPIVTNVCFGGPDLTTAYVTLSGTGRLARIEWDRPGLRLPYQS